MSSKQQQSKTNNNNNNKFKNKYTTKSKTGSSSNIYDGGLPEKFIKQRSTYCPNGACRCKASLPSYYKKMLVTYIDVKGYTVSAYKSKLMRGSDDCKGRHVFCEYARSRGLQKTGCLNSECYKCYGYCVICKKNGVCKRKACKLLKEQYTNYDTSTTTTTKQQQQQSSSSSNDTQENISFLFNNNNDSYYLEDNIGDSSTYYNLE